MREAIKSNLSISLIVIAVALMAGCNQDPFSMNSKKVSGDYYLHRWEDGKTFYLEENGKENKGGGGVVDGTLTKIGWDSRFIVVRRKALFGGDKDGWMVIDVDKKTVNGPYDEIAEIPNTTVRELNVYEPVVAWDKL